MAGGGSPVIRLSMARIHSPDKRSVILLSWLDDRSFLVNSFCDIKGREDGSRRYPHKRYSHVSTSANSGEDNSAAALVKIVV